MVKRCDLDLSVSCIVTNNYTADALALAESIADTNRGVIVYVLVVGDLPDTVTRIAASNIRWIALSEILAPDEFSYFIKSYTPFEISCALRGRMHLWMHKNCETHYWVMLDSDMQVLETLEPVRNLLNSADVILTSHSRMPVAMDQVLAHEINLLNHGLYNGGFLAMRKSANARNVAKWFASRLDVYGYAGFIRSDKRYKDLKLFVDQIWLNLIPLYFDKVVISNDETLNLGHWNLFQGSLTNKNGKYFFDNRSVVIAHFSSVPADNPSLVSNHSTLYSISQNDVWADMFIDYHQRLDRYRKLVGPVQYSYTGAYMSFLKKRNHFVKRVIF